MFKLFVFYVILECIFMRQILGVKAMKRVAVILADGFEEMEAINTIDILRRATIDVEIVAISDTCLTGAHGITITADDVFDYYGMLDYDAIVFAGGMVNANTIASDDRVLELIKYYNECNKWICGICATPAVVFSKANILANRSYTCYPDSDLISMSSSGQFVDKSVVVSDNIITSQSPYTSMAYALTIAKELGYNVDALQKAIKGDV